ncbi:MAG TPA: hypothetical protein VGN22_11595, partial [Pseudonocardia sp.]
MSTTSRHQRDRAGEQVRRRHPRSLVAITLAMVMIAAACSDSTGSGSPTTGSTPTTGGHGTTGTEGGTGTTGTGTEGTTGTGKTGTGTDVVFTAPGVRLSAGHASNSTATPTPVVQGAPLDDATVNQIEARLPAWTPDTTLATPFNWPVQSKPAPVAGTTSNIPFPAR